MSLTRLSAVCCTKFALSCSHKICPGWIGYGNAYAAQEEGDAMSADRAAARLFPG